MANHSVTIERDGTFTPDHLQLNSGDTVDFAAKDQDAVLCIDSDRVFGEDRYEIAAGRHVSVTVRSDAPSQFEFIARMGDLSAPCRGSRDRSSGGGGGTVGGDPD